MNFTPKTGSLIGAIALIAACSVPAFAQGPRRGGQMVTVAQVPTRVLGPALKLTPEQRTKIREIEAKLQTDLKGVMPAPGAQPDPQAFRDAMQKSRTLTLAASAEIQKLLTEDQVKALPDLLKDVQAMSFAGVPPAALGALKLTPDQQKQIIKIGAEAQAALQQKIQDANGDFSQVGPAIQTLRQDARAKAEALLTTEQKDVLKKYPAQMGFFGRRPRPAGQ